MGQGVGSKHERAARMTDLAMIALTLLFFLLSWVYVRACERV